MSEELKAIIEAARVIAEHVSLESPFVSANVSSCGEYPIDIHFNNKPDFVGAYVKEPYKPNPEIVYCVEFHKGVKLTWFEDKENEDGSIKEDTE